MKNVLVTHLSNDYPLDAKTELLQQLRIHLPGIEIIKHSSLGEEVSNIFFSLVDSEAGLELVTENTSESIVFYLGEDEETYTLGSNIVYPFPNLAMFMSFLIQKAPMDDEIQNQLSKLEREPKVSVPEVNIEALLSEEKVEEAVVQKETPPAEIKTNDDNQNDPNVENTKVVERHVNDGEKVELLPQQQQKETVKEVPKDAEESSLKQEEAVEGTLEEEKGTIVENVKDDVQDREKPIPKENDEGEVLAARSKLIQSKAFSRQLRDRNKVVGIWSPLHRVGVSTIALNYSMYLAENRVYTALLEGLTENHVLADTLTRFTSKPKDWLSYGAAIQAKNANKEMDIRWTYENVYLLPLSKEDAATTWSKDALASYMETVRIFDTVLVDLPTGKMEKYTVDSLPYLDELWIVVDDHIHAIAAWKDYIHKTCRGLKAKVYLIFNSQYSFSQTTLLSDKLSIPLLTTIPCLHEQIAKNNYQETPIYLQEDVQKLLHEPFNQLTLHLLGKEFKTEELPAYEAHPIEKPTWIKKFIDRLKTDKPS